MKPQIWIPLVSIILLVAAIVGWIMMPPGESSQVKQVKQLASQMFDEQTTMEQRREIGEQMRTLGEELPEEQRREVFEAIGEQMRQRMTQRVREFAALPEDQRNAFLDQDIDRMEAMRREWEQRRQERPRDGGPGGRPDQPPGDNGRAGGPRPEGAGPPDGPRRPRSEEEREQRRRTRMDNSTAEDRAYFTEYIKAINKRREERGMEPLRRPGSPRRPR